MVPADESYVPPEQQARQQIDAMLAAAGWAVQDYKSINLYAGPGVTARQMRGPWAEKVARAHCEQNVAPEGGC